MNGSVTIQPQFDKSIAFKCGTGQPSLAVQAEDFGLNLANVEKHQAMINSVTVLYEAFLLRQEEASHLYNRIVGSMLPDITHKNEIIVPEQKLITGG